jgi:predicted RNA-binding Zn-ribbon protein involved in translation (DUF1610 family)
MKQSDIEIVLKRVHTSEKMALVPPTSTNDLLYFSNRSDGKQTIKAWTYKKICPQCKKARMGKPVSKGKVKIRATEYVCPSCNYTEQKIPHEESLQLEAQYTCGACGKSGEGTTQYKRKTVMGVKAYLLICQHCGEKILVTKKLKEIKAKKKTEVEVDDDE